jgi:hypothetical protein
VLPTARRLLPADHSINHEGHEEDEGDTKKAFSATGN